MGSPFVAQAGLELPMLFSPPPHPDCMHKVSGECAGLILKEVRKADWAVGEADL
jgi:hypothetical protein